MATAAGVAAPPPLARPPIGARKHRPASAAAIHGRARSSFQGIPMVTATSHPPLDPSAPPPTMAIRLAALAKVTSSFCAERRRGTGIKSPSSQRGFRGMSDSLTIRPVVGPDHDRWRALWDGYNAFYGRSGATALPADITRTTWERFFDAHEPVYALVA